MYLTRRFGSRYRRLALVLVVALLSIALAGCFQQAGASVELTPTSTPPPVQPTATEAPLVAQPPAQPTLEPSPVQPTQPPAVAQQPTAQGVFQGGPQDTQTAVQATIWAQATEILAGVTQTAAVDLANTQAAQGGQQPTEGGAQPTQPPGNNGQPGATVVVATPAPQGTAGAPGSGAAGTIDNTCTYTVADGDRIFRIALRFGTTPEALARANGMINIDLIVADEKLHIPNCFGTPTVTPTPSHTPYIIVVTATPSMTPNGPTPTITPSPSPVATIIIVTAGPSAIPTSQYSGRTYVVQDGDTLFSISLRFGVRVTALAQANNISDINLVFAGQRLIIP